jgi:hypothetical protein
MPLIAKPTESPPAVPDDDLGAVRRYIPLLASAVDAVDHNRAMIVAVSILSRLKSAQHGKPSSVNPPTVRSAKRFRSFVLPTSVSVVTPSERMLVLAAWEGGVDEPVFVQVYPVIALRTTIAHDYRRPGTDTAAETSASPATLERLGWRHDGCDVITEPLLVEPELGPGLATVSDLTESLDALAVKVIVADWPASEADDERLAVHVAAIREDAGKHVDYRLAERARRSRATAG